MQLSVIILNYNVRYFLENCILSVQKSLQNITGEIIVIDNNSTDDSCLFMENRFPEIKLIKNKINIGFSKGNNMGVKNANGKYICILNPDTFVAEDTFDKMLSTQNWNLNTGIIGCKLVDGGGKFLPESKRGVPTPWVAFTKIFGLFHISNYFGRYYAKHLSENQSGEVDILVGAFMVMERQLYNEIGGFDENCFMYSDDIDLSYRVLKIKKYNYYFSSTTVVHYKGESTIRDSTYMKRFHEAMNFFYKKHFKKSFLFDIMMNSGSFIFSFIKKRQQKKELFTADTVIFFSKSNTLLKLNKKILYFDNFEYFKNNIHINYEIIFDIKSFSYKDIIAFMEAMKSNNVSFKNYLSDSNFLIGSKIATNFGEIIKM